MACLKRHFRLAATLGAFDVVVHPDHCPDQSAEQIVGANTDAFRELADAAAEHDVCILLENLRSAAVSTAADLLQLIDTIDRPNVAINFDSSHANVMKLNTPAEIVACGRALRGTHISDNDGSGDQHRIPGEGTIDWPAVIRSLRDIDYTGPFNLEIPGARHSIPAVTAMRSELARHSAEYLLALP